MNVLVDTKNNTYLTSYGLSLLKSMPYSDLQISINESAVIEPTTSRSRKILNMSTELSQFEDEDRKLLIIFASLFN